MMSLGAAGVGMVFCLLLAPAARRLALAVGLVDRPDGHRKIHHKITPVCGGLAVLASTILAIAASFCFGEPIRESLWAHASILTGLLLGAMVLCAVGVLDDFGRLRGRHKLLGQLAAVTIVIFFGGWVEAVRIFGLHIDLGWLGIPFTMFFLLGAINSLNLIDGMDGLLGSVGVISSMALAAMAFLLGPPHLWAVVVALALAGALIGFLRHNLPPASMFMGDAGSMLVGLILGALAIHCSLKAPATIALALPVGLLILPIFDTAAAIVRRKLTGRSIYTTDRGHLHHCLLRGGLSTRWALAVVALCCIVACAGVLTSQAFENDWLALIAAGSVVAVLITTRLFGYAEFMLIKGRLLCMLSPAHRGQLEVRLQGTVAWKDLWHALLVRAAELNLRQLLLDVNAPALHEGYHARWDRPIEENDERPLWHVELPMTARGLSVGRLVLAGLPDDQPVWKKIAILMEVVEDFNEPTRRDGSADAAGDSGWSAALDVAVAAQAGTAPEKTRPATNAPHVGLEIEALQP